MNTDLTAEARRSRTAFLWVGVFAPLVILAAAAVVVLAWMPQLPEPVAVHWSGSGPDGFGPAWSYPVLLLGVGGGCVVLFAAMVAFAHKAPQSPRRTAVGPWSPTSRFLGATALGLSAFLSLVMLISAAVQRGLSDARQAPEIGGWVLLGFVVLVGVTVLGWFLQPRSPRYAAPEMAPAGRIPLAAGERAAWFGVATMAPVGAVVLTASLVVLILGTALSFALGSAMGWALLVVTIIMAVAVGSTLAFRVRVDAHGLRVRALLGWPDTRIPLGEAVKVETVTVNPFAEFGGWGWRFSLDGRRGVVLRAGEALQVTDARGRVFVVTVDGADEAAAVLDSLRVRQSHPMTEME